MKNKRGIADIIIIIFLALLSLAIVFIIWNMLKIIIEEESEISGVKIGLIKEEITIKDVKGDLLNPSIINISLKKGSGKFTVNTTGGTRVMEADIVSVVDLSRSMGGEKINEAKNATKSFIDSVLNAPENKMGLVGYETNVDDSNCHDLSENAVSLKNKVDNWVISGWTCICCGINKGVEYLGISEHIKGIMIMSDGEANQQCSKQGTGNSKQDAVKAAENAFKNYDIKVYAVGFGSDADEITLQSIANSGNGSYYFADISELEAIYTQISEEINEYASVKLFNHLKIVFYSETDFYEERITDIPENLETKTYLIDLAGKITDINKIEIYAVSVTDFEEEVIVLLDVWKI